MRSRIDAVGAYLPPGEVSSLQVELRLGLDKPAGWIQSKTSVRTRRMVEAGTPGSELATRAIQDALSRSSRSLEDIDCIILGSISPDVLEPATANIVQHALGSHAPAFDVKNACNGFLNCLEIADAFIRAGSYSCIAVAAGEAITAGIPWHLVTTLNAYDHLGALTLGDGGGAAIVVPSQDESGVRSVRFVSDGTYWQAATVLGGGSLYPREPDKHYFLSSPKELYAATNTYLPELLQVVLSQAGWRLEDVDLIVPHQVNMRMLEQFCGLFGRGVEMAAVTLPEYGNTGAASIPIALDHARRTGRLAPGTNVLLAGAGAGFTLCFAAVRW
jgi:acyl-CoA:acyl-CoA alkyltransferase